jgi:hypothetical protein
MNSVSLTRTIDFGNLLLPELGNFAGKRVEITIREVKQPDAPNADRWAALRAIGGKDLLDPSVYRNQRIAETAWAQESNHDADLSYHPD